MKKPDYRILNLLNDKRESKNLKRRKNKSSYKGFLSPFEKEQRFKIEIDKRIVNGFQSNLYNFLIEEKFITGLEDNSIEINIPECFNLESQYDETIEIIKGIIYTIWKNAGKEITINFSKCKDVDQSALFLLQIIRLELQDDLRDLDKKLRVLTSIPRFKFIESSVEDVNLHLLLCGCLPQAKLNKGVVPIDTLGYLKGSKSQKHYLENRKGIIGTKIVDYLNKCLVHNSFELTITGKNELGNMIGEILNNAEDHSPLNTYYVTGNYYMDRSISNGKRDNVGILNLSFLNFGYSIYEGLEETKDCNKDVYDVLDKVYSSLIKAPFSKENLFTLYALQDGVSRLKYEDNSRGTGTMTFINCFYSIGDYESKTRRLHPQLSILSGATQLICNNNYKPTEKEGKYILSLNKENDLSIPPDEKNLKSLKYKFPGTLLTVRFCLNNEHISKKLDEDGNKKN